MASVEYRASPTLPCDIPKMKRGKLEDLTIDQMRQIIDLQNELMCVKNVAHRIATENARLRGLLADFRQRQRPWHEIAAAIDAALRGGEAPPREVPGSLPAPSDERMNAHLAKARERYGHLLTSSGHAADLAAAAEGRVADHPEAALRGGEKLA